MKDIFSFVSCFYVIVTPALATGALVPPLPTVAAYAIYSFFKLMEEYLMGVQVVCALCMLWLLTVLRVLSIIKPVAFLRKEPVPLSEHMVHTRFHQCTDSAGAARTKGRAGAPHVSLLLAAKVGDIRVRA